MIQMAYTFFVLALIALLLGATGFAGASMDIAKLFLFGFLAIGGISLIYAMISGRRPPRLP